MLRIGNLRTHLATGSLTLTNARLRPTAQFASGPDSLPRLALDLPRLRLTGISLLALWRQRPQVIDSLSISGLRLRIDSLSGTKTSPSAPLHARLPARVPGVGLAHLAVRDARVLVAGRRRPRAAFERLDLTARHIRLDAAGAADSARLFYARVWQGQLRGAQARVEHHRIRVRTVAFDSQAGVVTVDSLRMRPTRIGRRGPSYLTMQIGRARLTGLQAAALAGHRFRADSLRIVGLHFDLTAPAKPPPPLHKQLKGLFPSFELADLRLTDGYVRLRGLAHAPIIRALQLHAEQLRIDSAASVDPARVLYARAWTGSTGAAEIPIEPPFYRVGYGRVAFATRPGTLRATDVFLTPTLTIAETARRKGHGITQLTVRVPELSVRGGDFGAFARAGSLLMAEVTFRQPRVFLLSDTRYPIDPEESLVTPEAVRKIPFPIDFRRIAITDGHLDFRFIGTVSPRYGTGRVTQLNGTVTNASNDPTRMTDATPMVARVSALFLDQCRAQATARMNLLDPRGRHRVTGTFGTAPAQIMNSILEPAALTRIQTGTVQRIDMDMTGDRDGIRGELRGAYRNLHIRLLNKQVEQTLLTKIKSKAANKIVVHDNNPDKPGEPLRVGRIESRRERRYSVFALWKQGLVSGALHAIGLGEEKAQKMSETQTEPTVEESALPAGPVMDKKPPKPLRILKKLVPGKRRER